MLTHDEIMQTTIFVLPSGSMHARNINEHGVGRLIVHGRQVSPKWQSLFASTIELYKTVHRSKTMFKQLANDAAAKGFNEVAEAFVQEAATLHLSMRIARDGIKDVLENKIAMGEKDD